MKSKRLLIGLIAGAFLCNVGISNAQTATNKLVEIGPDNLGGRSRVIIIDKTDETHETMYTAGVAGGLYKRTSSDASAAWVSIPYDVVLPISDMIQAPDNNIYLATGEGYVENGINSTIMAPKGRGLYRFNRETNEFTLIAATNPANNSDWDAINRLACCEKQGVTYFYAATNNGLFRWVINSEADWNAAPTKLFNGPVQDIEIAKNSNMVFFTSGSNLWKIGNFTSNTNPVNISSSCEAFGGSAKRIELAIAPQDENYIYALVTNKDGLLDGIYLTKNQQSWTKLNTSTTTPFSTQNTGWHNSSIAVDPDNANRVFVGGASIWVGEGFTEGSNYMWNQLTMPEYTLNFGDYMNSAYTASYFVHSGIHCILPVHQTIEGKKTLMYYVATDGGIYRTSDDFASNQALNKGFNTVQYNGIAVCPDGSLVGGAQDNSCTFIQSRNAHNGGTPEDLWYNTTNQNINHNASVIWTGNGGQVEASMFQMVLPMVRRGIFVSSENGNYGRAYNDYSDYTNTQTWTSGSSFASNKAVSGSPISHMALWETTNNTRINDSISFTLDTLGFIFRGNDTIHITGATQIKSGDKMYICSPAHFYYPFLHTFNHNFVARDEMNHRCQNPIANRIFITSKDALGRGNVLVNMTPTDYSKVYSDEGTPASQMDWYTLLNTKIGESAQSIAVSNDGNALFVVVANDTTGRSILVRIRGMLDCDMHNLSSDLGYASDNRLTVIDTISLNGQTIFNRPITSLAYDPRSNNDVVLVTFGGFNGEEPNLVRISNAQDDNYSIADISINNNLVKKSDPIYSSLIECTTGAVYVGTENGVLTANNVNSSSWSNYGEFQGVPVMSIRQQTKALPRIRFDVHSGINVDAHLFAKTKYPYAMYFGTYGRGIFMDMKYVQDTVNEYVNPEDFNGVPQVNNTSANTVSVYPNPAIDHTNLDITVSEAGHAVVRVYDLNGRLVYSENLGTLQEGRYTKALNCEGFSKGMYLVNINFGSQAATTKLIVR